MSCYYGMLVRVAIGDSTCNLAKLFPEPPVVAFRRPKSIKDTLVRAAVSRRSSTVGQCKPCGDKRCKCCLQLQHNIIFNYLLDQ